MTKNPIKVSLKNIKPMNLLNNKKKAVRERIDLIDPAQSAIRHVNEYLNMDISLFQRDFDFLIEEVE